MATLWLECNSTTTQRNLQTERRFLFPKTGWCNCGWSETQQQHRTNNKANEDSWTRNLSNFRETLRKWGTNHWKMAKLWLEWNSTTTQQTRNKANGDIKDVKTCRIFAINKRKWGSLRGEMAKLWLEWNYDNNTASAKTGTKRTGTKNTRTVLKCLFEICATMTCWRGWGAGLRV